MPVLRQSGGAVSLDERAEKLLATGLTLAVAIRDEDPADVRRSLSGLDRGELEDLTVLLAACVPVEVPASSLLGWFFHPCHELEPCGTRAAARRHRRRREKVDALCEWAEREAARVRQAQRRASLRAVAS